MDVENRRVNGYGYLDDIAPVPGDSLPGDGLPDDQLRVGDGPTIPLGHWTPGGDGTKDGYHGLIGAGVAAWPAVALVGSSELLMVVIRSAQAIAGAPPARQLGWWSAP